MPQDEPPPPGPRAAPPAAQGRPPERLAFDIAVHLGAIGLFAFLVFDLMRPFGALLIWSVIVAAILHPIYLWLAARLGRPRLAAALVTAGALVVMLGPVAMLATSLIRSAEWVVPHLRSGELHLPEPPQMLIDLPGIGPALRSNWELATSNLDGFLARYGSTLLGAGERAIRPTIRVAEGALTFFAAAALSGLLHTHAAVAAAALRRCTAQVLGARNARFVDLASATIRNVARGVIGVAAIQALLIGVGLIVAGVPAAGVLTLAALVFAIVQIGVLPIVLPVIAWVWFTRDTTTAALLTAYLVPAGLVDVPLKPLLLGKALTTPSLVIFAGVIGGAVAYGLIGLFLGPILLALAYEILRVGLYGPDPEEPRAPGGIE